MSQDLANKEEFEKELKNKLSFKSTSKCSEENTLLKAFKFNDLSDSGFCNCENFLKTMTRLGVNILNEENVSDYFNLYDFDKTGRINYRDFVTELFTPLERRRRQFIETESTPENNNSIEFSKAEIPKKEKRKYNLTSTGFRNKMEQNLDDNSRLVNKVKNAILQQGPNTMFEMQKTLYKFDVDNSGYIDIDEFGRLISEYNLNLIPDEIKTLFTCFDPSRSGKIFYEDFLNIMHGTLNDFRLNLVDELYTKLNKNNRNTSLELKIILGAVNDRKIGQENADELKDFILSHHDFFRKGINTNSSNEVTYNEFSDFFEVLSLNYKEDADFEKYLNNAFDLSSDKVKNEKEIPNEEISKDEKNENENETKQMAKEFVETLEKLRKILVAQGAKGVVNLIKNMKSVDLANSNGVDLDEFITVIQAILKNSDDTSFPVKEIHNIFNVYDIEEKGIMQYKKFLNDLLKLDEMKKSRKDLLEEIFKHIDFEGKGALDINELVALFKKTDPDPLPDLLEAFINFHNVVRGSRNPRVNLDDFMEFYNYINFLIPESKNDKIFVEFNSSAWRLDDKTFDERKNLEKTKMGGLGKQKNRTMATKLIASQKTPYGTIKDKINYNLNEENATVKYNVNKIEDIIQHLKNNFNQRGPRGLMAIRRTFFLIDENNNKKIEFKEFEKIFKKYRFNLSDVEISNLFNYFDKDGSGFIDYSEFVNGILGNLNDFRKGILRQVFEKIDINEVGYITVGQMRQEYNPKMHPLVRQGKRSEDEILADFIDVLEYHFNLLYEKNEEGADVNDIKVDFDDFCDFYKNISVCIDEDKYFEVMVLSEWGIKKDGKSLYQKKWNQQDA